MKIYQTFAMSQSEENEAFWEKIKQASPKWENIVRSLKAKGYTVLINQSTYGSIPMSVILGADQGSSLWRNIKKDFYDLVEALDLQFGSGEAYMEE